MLAKSKSRPREQTAPGRRRSVASLLDATWIEEHQHDVAHGVVLGVDQERCRLGDAVEAPARADAHEGDGEPGTEEQADPGELPLDALDALISFPDLV